MNVDARLGVACLPNPLESAELKLDDATTAVRFHYYRGVGVVVAVVGWTPSGKKGRFVPVVFGAHRQQVRETTCVVVSVPGHT